MYRPVECSTQARSTGTRIQGLEKYMANHPCISVRASKQNHTLNVRVHGSASTSCLGRVPVLYCTNPDFNSTNKQRLPASQLTIMSLVPGPCPTVLTYSGTPALSRYWGYSKYVQRSPRVLYLTLCTSICTAQLSNTVLYRGLR